MTTECATPQHLPLKDIIGVFLKIGCTSFGSPTAHIAMMEHETVRKRAG